MTTQFPSQARLRREPYAESRGRNLVRVEYAYGAYQIEAWAGHERVCTSFQSYMQARAWVQHFVAQGH